MVAIMRGVNQTSHLDPKAQQSQDVSFFDDFLTYTTATAGFSTLPSGSGSTAWDGTAFGSNGAGHNVLITTQASTQWDAQGIATTNALFLPTASAAAMGCEAHLNFTSQSANNAMVFFGFMSTTAIAPGTNVIPTASYSGAIIYRLSLDKQWRIQVSNATYKYDYVTIGSDFACADGDYTLRVEFMPFSGTSVTGKNGLMGCASFSVNGRQVKDRNNFLVQVPFPYAANTNFPGAGTLAAMQVGAIAQASTANAQTLYVDYIQGNVSRGLTIPNG